VRWRLYFFLGMYVKSREHSEHRNWPDQSVLADFVPYWTSCTICITDFVPYWTSCTIGITDFVPYIGQVVLSVSQTLSHILDKLYYLYHRLCPIYWTSCTICITKAVFILLM
jgi:hypothetical protein